MNHTNIAFDEFMFLESDLISRILEFLPIEDKFRLAATKKLMSFLIYKEVTHLEYNDNIANHNQSFGQTLRFLERKLLHLTSIDFKYLEYNLQQNQLDYLPKICSYIVSMELNPWNTYVSFSIPLCTNLKEVSLLGLIGLKEASNDIDYFYFRNLRKFAFNYKTDEEISIKSLVHLNKSTLEFLEIHFDQNHASPVNLFEVFNAINDFEKLISLKLDSNVIFGSEFLVYLSMTANKNSRIKELSFKLIVDTLLTQKQLFALIKNFSNLKKFLFWLQVSEQETVYNQELLPIFPPINQAITHISLVNDLIIGANFFRNFNANFPHLQFIEIQIDKLDQMIYCDLLKLKHIRHIDITTKEFILPIDGRAIVILVAQSKHLIYLNVTVKSILNWRTNTYDKTRIDKIRQDYQNAVRPLHLLRRRLAMRRDLV